MKYIIDRIEDNIAILENQETKEMIDIDINELPANIKEGNVLIYENKKYYIDVNLEQERKKNILEKFQKLRKNDW